MTLSIREPLTMPRSSDEVGATRVDVSVLVVISGPFDPLTELYRAHAAALREAGYTYEFIFVTHPDRRRAVEPLLPLAAAGEPIQVLEAAQNPGETALLRSGFAYCSGTTIVTLPPSWRIRPEALPQLVRRIEDGAQFVLACRDSGRDPYVSRTRRRLVHSLVRRMVGGDFHDLGSGVAAMRPEVLREVPLYGETARFLPLLAQREGFRAEELVVPQHAADQHMRLHSPGIYMRRLMDLIAVFFMIRFREKPLRFFGLIGSLLTVLGGALLSVMFVQRLAGQPLAERPLLVVAVLLVVVGFQSIGLGLVGEIIVHSGIRRTSGYRLFRRS
jgi:hypothetical protein